MEITARNVNEAVESTLYWLRGAGLREGSRNGPVIVAPEPLMVTYDRPDERVLFWPERDANPIFHLMESIWMLAGRDDLDFVRYFNSRMESFSDDGVTLQGAYGHRWRSRFGVDQIPILIDHLKRNPETRRAVLTMWGVETDLQRLDSKDVCCNTQAYFDLRGGRLNMTVVNRSNDLMWGMFGANVVHFSFLQEFIASAVGAPIGVYRQFSNNPHLYTEAYDFAKHLDYPPISLNFDAYRHGVAPAPIMDSDWWQAFLHGCEKFCKDPFDANKVDWGHSFFPEVAHPMAMVAKVRKEKTGDGYYWAERIAAPDWKIAVRAWIERRENVLKA